ncbi:MAG: MMPL family transporter [Campylobacterota bacterium]|nr:MMPL family transporter [Campylobacterota bacterium]
MLHTLYKNGVLKYPLSILILLLSGLFLFSINITKLEIDASAETLLLDDDKDLAFTRTVNKRFEGNEILVLAYKPKGSLLSKKSLNNLKSLTKKLETLPRVKSVTSMLSVPLLFSPIQNVEDLLHNTRTLLSKDIDFTLAKKEFLSNPLYKENLVNKDFTITSVLITLVSDSKYNTLLEERKAFKDKALTQMLTDEEQEAFTELNYTFKSHRDLQRILQEKTITDIRTIMTQYQDNATLFLGGVQMISNDIVGFVKSDLVIYGSLLIVLLILVLGILFRKPRWVLLPILICTLSIIAITSALGFWGWEITVISSNFIALQLIITLSIVLHLIIRYEELNKLYPHASSQRLILLTMLSKAVPTFFAIVTTIAGFSSLLFAHIHPIINLGWMMSAGIVLSFIIAFIVFPTVLMLLPKSAVLVKKTSLFSIPKFSTHIVLTDKKWIFIFTFLSIIFSLTGASKIIVENSFINYFKKDTHIYQGMKIIDQELGGTTPLDVILTFKEDDIEVELTEEDSFEDSFEAEFSNTENEDQYWFTDEKIALIQKVHTYLEQQPQIGNIQSFATLLDIGKKLNNNKALDAVEIAILYKKIPTYYKDLILTPYVNIEHNQIRFSTRIVDSNKELRRNLLIKKINQDLTHLVNQDVAHVKLSNLMVMYNNMLQSLFTSQITTLTLVLLILGTMFLLLFRSFKLTFIALGVNIIPIGIIFGFMGWLHIPLDIMTITIAAIAMGISVDNTIHYIHRFQDEFRKNPNYTAVIEKTNSSIGNAMYYTSLTVMIGFSILTLSNLIPTIYFGLLTMLVMAAALLSNLILLPKLLLLIKPLRS